MFLLTSDTESLTAFSTHCGVRNLSYYTHECERVVTLCILTLPVCHTKGRYGSGVALYNILNSRYGPDMALYAVLKDRYGLGMALWI